MKKTLQNHILLVIDRKNIKERNIRKNIKTNHDN